MLLRKEAKCANAETMPAGRPSLYREEYAEMAYKLCLLGAKDKEIADIFKTSEQTINAWKEKHPEFLESCTRGKIEADANVASRLYMRAMGYSHKAVKIFMPAGADQPVYADYIEHYPPDTQAATWWLRNRHPDKWKDKTSHELSGPDGAALVPALNIVIAGDAEPKLVDVTPRKVEPPQLRKREQRDR